MYKLAKNRTMFWDPMQSEENKKLLEGQCKELRETERVSKAKRNGFIEEATSEEIQLAEKNIEALEMRARSGSSSSGGDLKKVKSEVSSLKSQMESQKSDYEDQLKKLQEEKEKLAKELESKKSN